MDMALTVTPTIGPLSIDPRIITDRTIGHASPTAASIVHGCWAGVAGVGGVFRVVYADRDTGVGAAAVDYPAQGVTQ